MVCPQCEGIETSFSQKFVQKELREYREKGLNKVTRLLINQLKIEGLEDLSLLDIGGGVGAIQYELLKSGMISAISVEASSVYLEAAKEEAERQGLTDRISFHHGNYVDLAPDIPTADLVTLDRVICCYHTMELVKTSITHARKLYALIYPRDIWRTKVFTALENFVYWLKRSKFRSFIHPTKDVHAITQAHSFQRCFSRKFKFWQIEIFKAIETKSE